MIEFTSPAMPQRRTFPTLVVRQSRRRSADQALGACPKHHRDNEYDRHPNREQGLSKLDPTKSPSTAVPAVRRSTPTPLKSP